MKINGNNLCDFCFKPISGGEKCPYCGLSHANYILPPGLLAPGTNLLGKYIIGKTLGRGGFGATYVAYSSDRKKPVAIKEYLPVTIACRSNSNGVVTIISEDKRDIFVKGCERFYKEAQTIYGFGHNSNIVSVYEFFYTNNTAYFSMEYLEGSDLKKYIEKKGGCLDEREAIHIFSKVCEALSVVHDKNMLHRDIAPDNIYICSNGDVKLIDFGSARQYVSDGTNDFSVIVKRGFAPAEQYVTNGKQGVWTDIYAIGASIYYSITGKMPPEALSMAETGITFDDVYISDDLKAIISKCLKYRIEDRYKNVEALREALEAVMTKEIPVIDSSFEPTDTPIGEVGGKTISEPVVKKTFLDIFKNSDKVTRYMLYGIAGLLVCLIIVFSIALYNSGDNSGRNFVGGGGTDEQETTGEHLVHLGEQNGGTDVNTENGDDGDNTHKSIQVDKPGNEIDSDKIKSIIDDYCEYTDFGIYVKNIKTGYTYSYNAEKKMLASAMSQVVVLDVIARTVEEYGIDISGDAIDFYYVPNGKEAPDSQSEDGHTVSIKKCIEDVAIYGDNNKFNHFIDYMGYLYDSNDPFYVINNILHENGYSATSVNRKIITNPDYIHSSSELNTTSAHEIADIFEHLVYCGSLGTTSYMKNIFRSVSRDGEPIGLKEYLPSFYSVCNANGLSAQATNNVAVIADGDTELVVSILAITPESKTDVENYENREAAVSEIINYIADNQF